MSRVEIYAKCRGDFAAALLYNGGMKEKRGGETEMTLYELSKKAGVSYQTIRTLVLTGSIKAERQEITKVVWTVSEEEAQRYISEHAARVARKSN